MNTDDYWFTALTTRWTLMGEGILIHLLEESRS